MPYVNSDKISVYSDIKLMQRFHDLILKVEFACNQHLFLF